MQIGAINSTNFKGLDKKVSEEKPKAYTEEELADVYLSSKRKAESNVSPLTCVVGVASGIFALKNGSKAIGWIRGAAATILGTATKKVAKHLPVLKKKANLEENIASFFKRFTNEDDKVGKNIDTWEEKFIKTFNNIFGSGSSEKNNADLPLEKLRETKGGKAVNALNDRTGVYLNPLSVGDNVVAGILGYGIADGVSDGVENTIDNHSIRRDVKKFIKNAEQASEMASL